jgi:hypothetical protein
MGRGTGFAKGFFIGLLGPPVLALALFVAFGLVVLFIVEVIRPARSPDLRVHFATRGADLTRSGAATMVIRHDSGSETRQTCRGVCDDLAFWAEGPKRVEVRDQAGRPLLDERRPLRPPFTPRPAPTELAGRPLTLSPAP